MFIPDPGNEFFHPGSQIHIKDQKIVSKLLEIWSGLSIPDSDPDFLPIPDPGSRVQKDPGSRIRNTGLIFMYYYRYIILLILDIYRHLILRT